MKDQRLDAIREVLTNSLVTSQDELRRKLRRRGIEVTQATLSRDMHELRSVRRARAGMRCPTETRWDGAARLAEEDDSRPSLAEMIDSFGLRVQQAMNQVVIGTVMGGAQPVAAAMDYEEWPEVVGTLAGDDTVLVICPDVRRAAEVKRRIRTMLES